MLVIPSLLPMTGVNISTSCHVQGLPTIASLSQCISDTFSKAGGWVSLRDTLVVIQSLHTGLSKE